MKSTLDILNELNSKIQHLKTPTLRAESLTSFLNTEKENYSKTDLLAATKLGTVEMLDAMKKVEMTSDFDVCIYLLNHFIKSGDFDVAFATRPKNQADQERLQEIKERLRSIVDIDTDEPTFF